MNAVAKYARTVLNSIEKRPRMWGEEMTVEMQYLLALEFLALAEGYDIKAVRKAHSKALQKRFKTSQMPAACHDLSSEEIVLLLKSVRSEIDPDMSIDITDDINNS